MDGQRAKSFSVYRADDGRTVSLSGKDVSYGYPWIFAIYGDESGGEKRRRAGSRDSEYTGDGAVLSVFV